MKTLKSWKLINRYWTLVLYMYVHVCHLVVLFLLCILPSQGTVTPYCGMLEFWLHVLDVLPQIWNGGLW